MKVTVVVPVYNVELYLQCCVDSLLKQSYKELEIILVDDGSTDNSGHICDRYANLDNRIKVIHKKNGGLSDARNAGIDIALGDYITFIDSDDFILPDMIERLYKIAIDYNADIVECRHTRVNANETYDSFTKPESDESILTYENNEKMKVFFEPNGSDTTAWGKLYKTSLFNDIRYPVGKLHEDVYTTYKLIHCAHKLAITNYKGYAYRVNNNSITGSSFSEKRLDSVEGKELQAKFVANNYPELSGVAYSDIIYSCNQCLLKMAKSKYKGKQAELYLQKKYREYGKYYLKEKYAFYKKLFCLSAMISTGFTKKILEMV